MASFMGRAGAGTGAASRALDPLRSRLRPAGSQRTYLSISHLRSLHIELVSLLYSAGATSATPSPSSSGDAPSLSAKQNRRLVEILRSIAELVRDDGKGLSTYFKPQRLQFFFKWVCVRTPACVLQARLPSGDGSVRGPTVLPCGTKEVYIGWRLGCTRPKTNPWCMLGLSVYGRRTFSECPRACLNAPLSGRSFWGCLGDKPLAVLACSRGVHPSGA